MAGSTAWRVATVTARAALASLVALAACGGEHERAAAPPSPSRPDEPRDAAPLPPVSPFAALDAARLDALAAVSPPGLTVAGQDRSATSLVIALRADAPPRRGLVTIGPCLDCRPMVADAWQDAIPDLRALMPGAVEDDPATTFALDAVGIAGHPCIATWELGAVAYGGEIEATHAARIYCHDGATELVVRVDDAAIDAAASADAVRAGADRAALEAAARDVAAAYLGTL